ncbi:MAG TPA: HypC/HybG/HupF family hydrogenase formation chaperone [Alicyclobacillus sp.]|nr:HypC/HybG/HupF family hydrogenase formation chaperone [Alicyclobacillus sp.]
MCLAVPGQIVSIEGEGRTATVDMGGVRRRVSLELLDDVRVGQYVLVHVGFALQTIDEAEARETLEMLETYFREELEAETGGGDPRG